MDKKMEKLIADVHSRQLQDKAKEERTKARLKKHFREAIIKAKDTGLGPVGVSLIFQEVFAEEMMGQ